MADKTEKSLGEILGAAIESVKLDVTKKTMQRAGELAKVAIIADEIYTLEQAIERAQFEIMKCNQRAVKILASSKWLDNLQVNWTVFKSSPKVSAALTLIEMERRKANKDNIS